MKRLMLATAAIALVPGFALAQDEKVDPNADTTLVMPNDQAADADPATTAEPTEGDAAVADGTDPAMPTDDAADVADADTMAPTTGDAAVADTTDPMMPKTDGAEIADADAIAPTADGDMANAGHMYRASYVIGSVIYTLSADEPATDWDLNTAYDAVDEDWERIGSIEDVVFSVDGGLEGVVAEVGGFLGIGDKLVMLPLNDVKMVMVDEDEFAVVTPYSSDELTDMQSADEYLGQ